MKAASGAPAPRSAATDSSPAPRWFGRAQVAVATLLALGITGVLAHGILRSPDVPFLLHDFAPWIVAQTPLQTSGMEIDLAHPPLSFFERSFSADGRETRVTLRARALRELTLFLNDRELRLPETQPADWKRVLVVDVTPHLVAGQNVLFAKVRNPAGNPALQLRIDGLAAPLATDTQWRSAWEGDPVAYAAIAADAIRHPDGALPSPLVSLRAKALPLLGFAALGIALFALALRRPQRAASGPRFALGAVALFWLVLFFRLVRMPAEIGFDAAAHLEYIRWLGDHASLPPPQQGSAMYHPPLYHALTALLTNVAAQLGVGARASSSLLAMASGFGLVLVARGMARALAPRAPWIETGAILAAGFFPMSVILATCVSNEASLALFASLALLVALRALLRDRASLRDDVALGLALGAAALVKYSSLLWIPLLIGAVAAKRLAVERARIARSAGGAALAVAIVALLAGWVYVRNAQLHGDPLIWNLNATPGKTWWQLPGFHTAAYFLHFGESLTQPWFASFYSFWDSLYSTLWGDGLLSGAAEPRLAPRRWNYEWMAAGFLLAVPATGLLLGGWLCAAREALRGADLGRRLAFSLLAVLPPIFVATIASAILHYPFWSGPKAFYALALAPSLALFCVLGFAALDGFLARRLPVAIRALPHAWAASFLGAIAWTFLG